MRILIAPDKLKSACTARQAALAIARGLNQVRDLSLDLCPLADGGEGTVEALATATKGRTIVQSVTGPLPATRVNATFAFLGDNTTAVIEMAAASGLALLNPNQQNPLVTTTYGTGELINAAIAQGATKIILGIGGSATVDAGLGCLQAMGIKIERSAPASPPRPLTAADLPSIRAIIPTSNPAVKIIVACDVTNPLFGPTGAAPIFASQKGADAQTVNWLDDQLHQLAQRTNTLEQATTPGAGAAGGLGYGLVAFAGASFASGFNLIAQAVNLEARIRQSDYVFTAEGQIDASTNHGKTVAGVAQLCKLHNIPCIALAGAVAPGADALLNEGLTAFFAIADGPISLQESTRRVEQLLERTAANIARCLKRSSNPPHPFASTISKFPTS